MCGRRKLSSRTASIHWALFRYQVLCWEHDKGRSLTLHEKPLSNDLPSGRLKSKSVLNTVIQARLVFRGKRDQHKLDWLEKVLRRVWALNRTMSDRQDLHKQGRKEGRPALIWDKCSTLVPSSPSGHLLPPGPGGTSATAQPLFVYCLSPLPHPGLCPCCSLYPCPLQLSSFRETLWTLRSLPPSLEKWSCPHPQSGLGRITNKLLFPWLPTNLGILSDCRFPGLPTAVLPWAQAQL